MKLRGDVRGPVILFVLATSLATCSSPEIQIHFVAASGSRISSAVTSPDAAAIRALRHPSRPTVIASVSENGGLRTTDVHGIENEHFEDLKVAEVERDPGSEDRLVAFIADQSRFGIVEGNEVSFRASPFFVRDFVLADFDGDDVTDVVAVGEAGTVFLLPNYAQSDDLVGLAVVIGETAPVPTDRGRPRRIDVGDFDADDQLDVVVIAEDEVVRLFLGSGQPSGTEVAAQQLVIALNVDGSAPDEIFTIGSDGRGSLLQWDGNSLLEIDRFDPIAGTARDKIDVGDLNADERDDVIFIDEPLGIVKLVLADADGLSPAREFQSPVPEPVEGAVIGDYDGDGSLEVALLDVPYEDSGCR